MGLRDKKNLKPYNWWGRGMALILMPPLPVMKIVVSGPNFLPVLCGFLRDFFFMFFWHPGTK